MAREYKNCFSCKWGSIFHENYRINMVRCLRHAPYGYMYKGDGYSEYPIHSMFNYCGEYEPVNVIKEAKNKYLFWNNELEEKKCLYLFQKIHCSKYDNKDYPTYLAVPEQFENECFIESLFILESYRNIEEIEQ